MFSINDADGHLVATAQPCGFEMQPGLVFGGQFELMVAE